MKILCLLVWMLVSIEAQGLAMPGEERRTAKAIVQLTESERTWLAAHLHVRWGIDPDWPPFSTFDRNGALIGIDADITRLVAARVGLQLTMVRAATWSEVLAKARAGEVDFLSATSDLPERAIMFNFTRDYGLFPVVIVTREEAPFLTLELDLRGMSIAAARDHVATRQLERDFPELHFVYTDTTEQALQLVSRRNADAAVVNLPVATRAVRLNGLTNLKISGITRYEFSIRFAVRKDMPELAAILDKGLATITPAELERIYAAHLTPDIGKARNWGVWRRRACYCALIGAAVIAGVLIWNWSLKRQIQRRKRAETDLREAHDSLEQQSHELGVRVRQVEKLNAELVAANQNLESFSSSVSHDLRAPVRRVIAFAELMRETAGNLLTEEERDFMNAIIHESSGMDRLIHDLLEFARLGRTDLRKQPVNMIKMVRQVIDEFQPQLQGRTVVWIIGALSEVFGDPNLLRYAMVNLIDNALKYSRHRSETRVTIDMLPKNSSEREAVFFIKDNGCGFDMNSAKRIFAPFQRLHSSAEFEGTGIGLANVQRIVQKHGGQIWFESEPDKGATFYFILPRPPSTVEGETDLAMTSSANQPTASKNLEEQLRALPEPNP
jgi:signal transduction histidine kinase